MDRPRLPGFALACGLLWLLAGALYKFFDGSPNDLPQPVVEHSPFDKFNTFRLAIAAEFAVVGLVLTVPRLGWIALSGIFSVFLAVLVPLALGGESSCGCFGSNVTIAPWQMMLIDGSLLGLLLFSAPWRLPKEAGLGAPAFIPFLLVAIVAPLMKLDPPTLPTLIRPNGITAAAPQGEGDGQAADPGPEGADPGPSAGGTEEPRPAPAEEEATEPSGELPEFYELRSTEWTGQDFYATDIAAFADQSMGAVLPNSHVVVYPPDLRGLQGAPGGALGGGPERPEPLGQRRRRRGRPEPGAPADHREQGHRREQPLRAAPRALPEGDAAGAQARLRHHDPHRLRRGRELHGAER